MERYVLIRPGALGDALLTFPTLALLRRARPDAYITFVARRDVLALAEASGLADATAPYDSPAWAALFADEADGDGDAHQIVAGSAVVAWIADAVGQVARSLGRLGAREVVVQPGRPPLDAGEHAALYLAGALVPLGVSTPDTLGELVDALPALRIPASDAAVAEAAWRGLALPTRQVVVALHAGSGGAAKRWPPASFTATGVALCERGMQPLLVEGPQDAEVTAAIRAAMGGDELPVVRGLSVGALAALLGRCACYLGNDSGVTHLVALVGTPVVALFGPSDAALWRPLGREGRVLRATTGDMAAITVAAAVEAMLELLRAGR